MASTFCSDGSIIRTLKDAQVNLTAPPKVNQAVDPTGNREINPTVPQIIEEAETGVMITVPRLNHLHMSGLLKTEPL